MASVFVYVIGPNNGPQKIGIAKDVRLRKGDLQVGCPFDLHIHAAVPMETEQAARNAERMAHRILSKSRQRGEWFNVSPIRAIDVVRIAATPPAVSELRPDDRIILMREAEKLTWDEYEAAIAFQELVTAAAQSGFKGGYYKGANNIERRSMAAAMITRLAHEIRMTAGGEAIRVLMRLAVHAVEPATEEMVPLRQALKVVAERLEDATSAKSA